MAGWPILADESAVDCFEILRDLQRNGLLVDIDASVKLGLDSNDKDRCLFDKILSRFLKEVILSDGIRSVPPKMGDGQSVDLYKLYCVVTKRGGYDSVTKRGLWSSVAEELGLGYEVASALKLVYYKYLDTFERCVQSGRRDEGEGRGLTYNGVAEPEVKVCSEVNKDESLLGQVHCSKHVDSVMAEASPKCIDDNDNDENVHTLEHNVVKEDVYSRKRKREMISGMLDWVTELAKNPSDSAYCRLLKFSKHKGYGGEEFHVQVLEARDAWLQKRPFCFSADRSLLQKKQKMHPSMYEDPIGRNLEFKEKSRSSQRHFSRIKSHSHSSSESSEPTQNHIDMDQTPANGGKEYLDGNSSTPNGIADLFDCGQAREWARVGDAYQAKVPQWTGVTSESDSKWLGTQHWPVLIVEKRSIIERDPIGKGRRDSCGCQLRGSVECVRFHISEKRMRLKLELGKAFSSWEFKTMGEEVSLSWTEEEEKRFKATVRLNPASQNKSFWNQALKSFPAKKRRDLVSYYFNVFVLRRRSYQSRVTPNKIDSDDDESEFGSLSNGFGHEAVKVRNSKPVFCSQNRQCFNME